MKIWTSRAKICTGIGLAFPVLSIPIGKAWADAPPNVLLVITDDQAYGDLSLNGNPVLTTPRLDALGNESIRLEQFYVNSICAPTRASLLTGRYHLRTGVTDVTRRREVLNPAETTLGELFKTNGYRTGYFGKWHNGSVYPETPDGQGFDEFIGFPYGHTTLYFDPILQHNGTNEQKTGYITDVLTDEAIHFIETAQQSAEPFFCYLAYNAPHTPIMAPQPLIEKYQLAGMADLEAGIYAMVESLDTNMGRLLERLDTLNLADNTLVIFMSDNGPAYDRYNAGMKGKKANHHEGGVRVPCFWRWPSRWTGPAVVNRRLMHIDVLPTLAELCGLNGTQSLSLDGQSFVSLLDDPQATWPERTFCLFPSGDATRMTKVGSVRDDRWLAVKNWSPWELYDLPADPGETNNLAAAQPEIVLELQAGFDAELAAFNIDPNTQTPIPVGNPERPAVLLEAHDAVLYPAAGSGITYSYISGFAHNWITDWTDSSAYPEWPINVLTQGFYQVTLHYGLAPEDAGVRIRVRSEDSELFAQLNDSYIAPVIPQPFLLPDEAEKYETRIWTNQTIGLIYLNAGEQTLRLMADTIPGTQALELKDIELQLADQLPGAPTAGFSASPTAGEIPLPVTFTDTSVGTITNRFWSFGDGAVTNTSETDVQHTYTSTGTYTVVLTVSGPGGSGTNTQTACISAIAPAAPEAGFTAEPLSGFVPLEVSFTETSSGIITNRLWDFGDGTTTNITATSVQHTYTNGGTFAVTLTVNGPGGSDADSQTGLIYATQVAITTTEINGDGADWTIGLNASGLPTKISNGAAITVNVCDDNANYSQLDECAVLVFQLPDLSGKQIISTGLKVTWEADNMASVGTHPGSADTAMPKWCDLYAVRYSAANTVDAALDYGYKTVTGSNDVLIQSQFLYQAANLTMNPEAIETSDSGGTALAAWLTDQYTAGAQAGDFIFLRIHGQFDSGNAWKISSGDSAAPPVLTIQTALPTGPTGTDNDSDGLPNDWETLYFGGATNANPSALSANGLNSVYECYIAGLNPTDPASLFTVSNVWNVLQWNAVSGRVYSVYSTTNLMAVFQPLETNILWPQNSWTDQADRAGTFYNLKVELP